MKILLTGASGYVGGALLGALEDCGHDVHCLTRSHQPLAGVPASRHLVHDLCRPITESSVDYDLVLHAAGANDIQSADPAMAVSLTALTAGHCAEFAARQKNPNLLYVSTFQVYGLDSGPIDETTPPQPRNDYALTHLFAEQWIERFARTTDLRFVNARVANVAGMPRIGPMKRWSLVPGCLCRDAVVSGQVSLQSSGRQQRDFLPLADVARRLVRVVDDFRFFADGAVNICSGAALSIGEIAGLVAERHLALTGRPCPVQTIGHDAAAESPPPLVIDSRYFARYPGERLTPTQSRSLMSSCIDQTYARLASVGAEEMNP